MSKSRSVSASMRAIITCSDGTASKELGDRFGAAFDGIMNVSLQSIEVGRIFNPERIGQTNVNSLNPVWYSTENSESPNMMIFVQKFSAEL
jgi:hypothetical protein